MERYGQRMNELMNLDSDASQEQFNYIEDYRPSVRVFKDFISILLLI